MNSQTLRPVNPDTTLRCCPSCGYNLTSEASITRGDWTLTPNSTLYRGRLLRLPKSHNRFLFTLAQSYPRRISSETLLMRVAVNPYEVESNLVSVQSHRLRERLAECNVPTPFDTMRGVGGGYQWTAPDTTTTYQESQS